MKLHFLSDIVIDDELLDRFTEYCSDFTAICHRMTSYAIPVMEATQLAFIGSGLEYSPKHPSIKDLENLLDEMSKIIRRASDNEGFLTNLHSRISQVKPENRQAVTNTGVLRTILPKVRNSAKEIPSWIADAKAVNYSESVQGQALIKAISDITDVCWSTLVKMNKVLDAFPIDRSDPVYSHLPENEAEL
jgi:hypothetical protein